MKQHHIVPYGLKVLVSVVVMLPGFIMAQENTGTSRQPLVHGSLVSEANQEDFGLLTFQYMTATSTTSCSASLLRNQWVIIAAHCVDAVNSSGQPMPDPARPGQNVLKSIAQMTLSAGGWHNPQAKGVIRVETFRPYDVAIIQVANPFNIHGSTTGYSRLIFQDGQFPYFGNPIGASLIMFGRGINKLASAEGASAKPSEMDGFYRVAYAKPSYTKDNLYWYPSENGYMIAGGDSGGPSYAWVLGGYALVGVHSKTKVTYVPGMPQTWDWATSTPEAGDCQITGVWNSILGIIGPPPPPSSDSDTLLEPPPPGFIGTFAQTPPDFQPFFIYGIRPNGELLWYRKDSKASAWQGPKTVGTSWNHFKDVISAGGNRLYALTQDNKLLWYQHDGFNDGTFSWKPTIEVGNSWTFSRIFAGGNGIVYAIRQDGILLWYRHIGFQNGNVAWAPPSEVGSGWGGFKDVFSTGQGAIYAVKPDGTLLLYQHNGFENGTKSWSGPRIVGSEWNQFQQIVPAGDGVIFAIRPNGELLWYKHLGLRGNRTTRAGAETWEGPVLIGSGWQDFTKIFASIPEILPPGGGIR